MTNHQINAKGFHSLYPAYGIPTCERRTGSGPGGPGDDDGGEFTCPAGRVRKPNGVSAVSLFLITLFQSHSIPTRDSHSATGDIGGHMRFLRQLGTNHLGSTGY